MLKYHDELVKVNHNSNWVFTSDHPNKTLIIGSLRSDKNNMFLILIKHQWPDIDKIYLFAKDPFESKY